MPGFTVDEDWENLSTSLVLPPFMEHKREEMEVALPTLETSHLQA